MFMQKIHYMYSVVLSFAITYSGYAQSSPMIDVSELDSWQRTLNLSKAQFVNLLDIHSVYVAKISSSNELSRRDRLFNHSILGKEFDQRIALARQQLDELLHKQERQSLSISRFDIALFEEFKSILTEDQLTKLPHIERRRSIERLITDPIVRLWLRPNYGLNILPLTSIYDERLINPIITEIITGIESRYLQKLSRLRVEAIKSLRSWVDNCSYGLDVHEEWHSISKYMLGLVYNLHNEYQRAYNQIASATIGESRILFRYGAAFITPIRYKMAYMRLLPKIYYASLNTDPNAVNSTEVIAVLSDMLDEVLVLHDTSYNRVRKMEFELSLATITYGNVTFDMSTDGIDKKRFIKKYSTYMKDMHIRSLAILKRLNQIIDRKAIDEIVYDKLQTLRDSMRLIHVSELGAEPSRARRDETISRVPHVKEILPLPISREDIDAWITFTHMNNKQKGVLLKIHEKYIDNYSQRYKSLINRIMELDIGKHRGTFMLKDKPASRNLFSPISDVKEATSLLKQYIDLIVAADSQFFNNCSQLGIFYESHNNIIIIEIDRALDVYNFRPKEPTYARRRNRQELALLTNIDRYNPLNVLFKYDIDNDTRRKIIVLSSNQKDEIVGQARECYYNAVTLWCKAAEVYSLQDHKMWRKNMNHETDTLPDLMIRLRVNRKEYYSQRNKYISILRMYIENIYDCINNEQVRKELYSSYTTKVFPIMEYDPYKYTIKNKVLYDSIVLKGASLGDSIIYLLSDYMEEYDNIQNQLKLLSMEYETLEGLVDNEKQMSIVLGRVDETLAIRRELNKYIQLRIDLLVD